MAMVCPKCQGVYEQRLHCSQCGVRLVYRMAGEGSRSLRLNWKITPWGRMVAGLVLAQGLFYGLRHLCTAALIVGGDDVPRGVSATLTNLVLIQGLQAIGVFAAGALAGAGQRQGALYGALVGVLNGVVWAATSGGSGKPLPVMELFGQPFLLAVVGALGGLGGILVWKPPTSVSRLAPGHTAKRAVPAEKPRSLFTGRVVWGRVLLGILVSVSGTVLFSVVLKWILDTSKGELSISTELQYHVVTCEICVFMMIAGSALAGANTFNGMKQGVIVGLGSGLVLSGLSLASAHTAVKLFTFTVSASGSDTVSPINLILNFASAVSLGLVGGWFGGDLLPPLVARGWKPFRSHPT